MHVLVKSRWMAKREGSQWYGRFPGTHWGSRCGCLEMPGCPPAALKLSVHLAAPTHLTTTACGGCGSEEWELKNQHLETYRWFLPAIRWGAVENRAKVWGKEVLFACQGYESVPREASPTRRGTDLRFLCPSKQGVTCHRSCKLPEGTGDQGRALACRVVPAVAAAFMPPGKAEDGHLLLKKPHRWESSVAAVKLFQSRGRWPCPQAAGSWWAALVAILCHLLRGWRGWLVSGWGAGQGPRGDMEPSPLATSNKMATWAASPQARRRERASCPKEAVTSHEGLCQKVKIRLKATCLGACLHRSYGAFFYCFFWCVLDGCFQGFLPTRPVGGVAPARLRGTAGLALPGHPPRRPHHLRTSPLRVPSGWNLACGSDGLEI